MARKKRKNNTNNQKNHFKRRLLERYLIEIEDQVYLKLVKELQRNRGTFIYKISNRLTSWEIRINNENVPAICNKICK